MARYNEFPRNNHKKTQVNPMKMKHLVSALLLGIGLSALTGCTPTYPGGLSETEWNSLPPEKRANLKLQKQQLTMKVTV